MKKKLIILLASNLDPRGGGRETWISNFLNNDEIIQLYDSIVVIGSNISLSKKEIDFPRKVKVIKDKFRSKRYFPGIIYYSLFARKQLREMYNSTDSYDVISCGSWAESIAFYLSSIFKKNNVRSICWLRSIMIKELARIYPKPLLKLCQGLECFILKKYNIAIANGSDTSNYYLTKKVKNVVIANGIHTSDFTMNTSMNAKCQYIGRTSAEKGILHLIQAIRIIKAEDSYRDIVFCIIGDGPSSIDVKSLENDIDNLTYMGSLEPLEVKYELAQANISFHLTLSKDIGGGGVSHSLLEAMASGQRIVCWDNDIFNQVTGSEMFFRAKEGCIKSLVEQIKLSIKDCKEDAIQYPLKMKEYSNNYDFSVHVEKYCNLVY